MSKAHATIAGLSLLLLASSDTFAQQPPAIPVSVVAAEKRPLSDTNRFVGRVEAIERVDVRARITGFLEKILFKDGDRLKAGAPLYQIEKGPFEAAIQQAQAAMRYDAAADPQHGKRAHQAQCREKRWHAINKHPPEQKGPQPPSYS